MAWGVFPLLFPSTVQCVPTTALLLTSSLTDVFYDRLPCFCTSYIDHPKLSAKRHHWFSRALLTCEKLRVFYTDQVVSLNESIAIPVCRNSITFLLDCTIDPVHAATDVWRGASCVLNEFSLLPLCRFLVWLHSRPCAMCASPTGVGTGVGGGRGAPHSFEKLLF